MAYTTADLITTAFREIGVAPLQGSLAPNLSALGLIVLNRIFDAWNAEHGASYAALFSTNTLTIGLAPHTVGPSGATWTLTTARPVKIESAKISHGGSPAQWSNIDIQDEEWYRGLSLPAQTAEYPTDLFYNPTWPNGSIYFVGVPTAAKSVQLVSRVLLAQLALTDTFTLPEGYPAAVTATLKEELVQMPMFSSAANSELTSAASKARARIFRNNSPTPRLATADSGLRCSGSGFDFQSREFS